VSIWEKLSSIDCSEHVEKKGKFSYLAWSWAVAMVKEHYPEMTHRPLEDVVYADGSMEVRCEVTIEGQTHPMWLPVTDYNNNAIAQPNAFDINTARMRCLVKNFAVNFGLGHYIFAGESLPAPSPVLQEKYDELVELVAKDMHWELRRFFDNNSAVMDNLFNMSPDGKKTQFKHNVREVYRKSNDELKGTLAALEDAVDNPETGYSVTEIFGELGELETEYIHKGMNETMKFKVTEKLEKGE